MTAKAMAIVCAMCCLLAAGARADTGQGSSAEAFTALTQRILDEYYGRLDPDEKAHVDNRIANLGVDRAGVLESARETSSAAVIISATASSYHMPVALAAAAAQAAPSDPLVVNNFAAALRSIGRLDESIEVLVYADNLAPYSPTILTNLGNSYLDKGMLSEAEISYSKAIACDADFDAAHYGMSIIWVKRGNGNLAMDDCQSCSRGLCAVDAQGVYGAKGCGGSVGSLSGTSP